MLPTIDDIHLRPLAIGDPTSQLPNSPNNLVLQSSIPTHGYVLHDLQLLEDGDRYGQPSRRNIPATELDTLSTLLNAPVTQWLVSLKSLRGFAFSSAIALRDTAARAHLIQTFVNLPTITDTQNFFRLYEPPILSCRRTNSTTFIHSIVREGGQSNSRLPLSRPATPCAPLSEEIPARVSRSSVKSLVFSLYFASLCITSTAS